MRKVITISLNGHAYQVDEAGFAALSRYLDDAAGKLAGNPDAAEILADLEQAIGDKCETFLGAHKTVVTAEEVDTILHEMGPVEAAARPEPQSGSGDDVNAASPDAEASALRPAPEPGRRRLYRLKDGSLLGGVCTGLAAYFDTDVVWVRLAFLLLTCVTGVFILVWLAMLVVVPVARTEDEKCLARGGTPGTAPLPTRRLHRLPDAGMLGGVCAGIAAYFNIDAVLVRIVFVVLALLTGVGFALWLALLVLMPVARTPEQFAAAHGDAFSAQEVIDRARRRARGSGATAEASREGWQAASGINSPAGDGVEREGDSMQRGFESSDRGPRDGRQASPKERRQGSERSWHRPRQRPIGYAAQVAASLSLPILSALSAALFVTFLVALSVLLLDHRPLPLWHGGMHPYGLPRWVPIVALVIAYAIVASPIGAARRASHRYANGGYSGGWVSTLDRLLWMGLVALLLWGLVHFVPWIHDLFEGHLLWEGSHSGVTVL